MAASIRIEEWAASSYPEFPNVYLGRSGATLLLDALRSEGRDTIILPAFICPELPAMAAQAGLRVVHIDVDRTTMQMDQAQLAQCLEGGRDEHTVLLVDHPFGYPATTIGYWRRLRPQLLIVEDCVRALGSRICGQSVGHEGHWVLFSMYKVTVGNDDGALLFTRSPLAIRSGPARSASLRQWASGVAPLRAFHGWLARHGPGFEEARRDLDTPYWSPIVGVPSQLCRSRFERQLTDMTAAEEGRRRASAEIERALSDLGPVQLMRVAEGCETSAFYLSFAVAGRGRRDALVSELHRKGLFLVWAWNTVPAFFRSFANTFPGGSSGSVFLADHICHIPVAKYLSVRHRQRLIAVLQRTLAK